MASSPQVSRTSILHTNLAAPPPTITHASGPWLYSSSPDVTPIYDASGGAAVSSIGHAHPRIAKAIAAQVAKNEYVFAPHLTSPVYEELCQFLADSTGGRLPRAFICGSGSEAVEAAVKMARQYYVERDGPDTKRVHIISRDRSYHGNTLGALSVSGHKSRRAIYAPLLSSHTSTVSPCYAYRDQRAHESEADYVHRLVNELEAEFQRVGPGNVCAVFLETVAGLTLGAVAPLPGYLRKVKEVCERHGALFVLDEVLAGMGRTGTLHAWEQEDVVPDMQTLAKGLGAGYAPIGGLLVSQKIVDALMNGTGASPHFQTYQGHAIGCAAAMEVQKVIEDEKLLENVRTMAPYIEQKLRERLGAHKHVGNIRGRGMLWAVELVRDRESKEPFETQLKVAAKIQATGLRDFGIALLPGPGVVDGVRGDVIVIAPPFTITRDEVELVVERMANSIEAIVGRHEMEAKL